jgi:hypothetical protein
MDRHPRNEINLKYPTLKGRSHEMFDFLFLKFFVDILMWLGLKYRHNNFLEAPTIFKSFTYVIR